MGLIKGKQEFRTILDFSFNKLSKKKIEQSLRQVEVLEIIQNEDSSVFIENEIIVGMYQVRLTFNHRDFNQRRTRLQEYGGFRISIYEKNHKSTVLYNINLNKDLRFKHENWISLNTGSNLRIKHLTDIIIYLRRLNNLKIFL